MRQNKPAVFACICAGFALIGVLGPWVRYSIFFAEGSISGLESGEGKLSLLLAVVAAGLLYWFLNDSSPNALSLAAMACFGASRFLSSKSPATSPMSPMKRRSREAGG